MKRVWVCLGVVCPRLQEESILQLTCSRPDIQYTVLSTASHCKENTVWATRRFKICSKTGKRLFFPTCTAIEGPVRIQYNCLVPIYVFPASLFPKQNYNYTFMYLLAIYIFPGSDCRAEGPITHRYMNCRNRERGHAVSFLGIYVSTFQYSVF